LLLATGKANIEHPPLAFVDIAIRNVAGLDRIPKDGRPRPPRSMMMGITRSSWRYDAGACHALQSAILRRSAIARYACRLPVFDR
jgi:hypothetical protein